MSEPITSEMMAEAERQAADEIREKKLAAIRAKEEAARTEAAEEGAESPSAMRRGTDSLLRMAWMSLVPSFGLTLIWINVHGILRKVISERMFCKYGDEWPMAKVPMESYGVATLNLLAIIAILAILSVIVVAALPVIKGLEFAKDLYDAVNSATGGLLGKLYEYLFPDNV